MADRDVYHTPHANSFNNTHLSFKTILERPGLSVADPRTSVIEVLIKGPRTIEPQLQSERHMKRHVTHLQGREESVTSSYDILDSIRIRSTYLLDLLFDAFEVRSDHGGTKSSVNECPSHVSLYPFSILITYSEKSRHLPNKCKEGSVMLHRTCGCLLIQSRVEPLAKSLRTEQ